MEQSVNYVPFATVTNYEQLGLMILQNAPLKRDLTKSVTVVHISEYLFTSYGGSRVFFTYLHVEYIFHFRIIGSVCVAWILPLRLHFLDREYSRMLFDTDSFDTDMYLRHVMNN